MTPSLWHCWLGGRKGIGPVKYPAQNNGWFLTFLEGGIVQILGPCICLWIKSEQQRISAGEWLQAPQAVFCSGGPSVEVTPLILDRTSNNWLQYWLQYSLQNEPYMFVFEPRWGAHDAPQTLQSWVAQHMTLSSQDDDRLHHPHFLDKLHGPPSTRVA